MKKLFITLACLACVQSTYAATSALTESLLEYEAITNALGTNPSFADVIPPTEFIIDIQRITRKVNIVGTVKYKILTRVLGENEVANGDQDLFDSSSDQHHRKHHRHNRTHTYIATLDVEPNPGIGPNIVTVISITQVAK